MGLIVDKPELLELLDHTDKQIRDEQEKLRRVARALDNLAGETTLTGQGWTAAKRHASEVVKPQVEQAIAMGDRTISDNARFRACLQQYIEDDHIEEDGLAECVERIRSNANLLREAIDLVPDDDDTGLKGLMDRMLWDSQQKANRLEDKIRRLHALEQATRTLYQDIEQPDTTSHDISLDGDVNAVMAKLVNGNMNRKQLEDFFEKQLHINPEYARQLADFTIRYRKYAKDKKFDDKRSVYEYARILASTSYNSGMWRIAGGTYKDKKLISILKKMGYTDKSSKDFIDQMEIMHGADGTSRDSVDFIHMMGSLSCILNTGGGGMAYRYLGQDANSVFTSRSAEAATWGGDVASCSGGTADWNADMDAINIDRYLDAHPKQDRQQAIQDYYTQLSKGDLEKNRIRQFCANYDPEHKGDPQRGLDYLKQNGYYIAAQSSTEADLNGLGKTKADKQKTLNSFIDTLEKGLK